MSHSTLITAAVSAACIIVMLLMTAFIELIQHVHIGIIGMYAGGLIAIIALLIAFFNIPSLQLAIKRGDNVKDVKLSSQLTILTCAGAITLPVLLSPYIAGAIAIFILGLLSNIKKVSHFSEMKEVNYE